MSDPVLHGFVCPCEHCVLVRMRFETKVQAFMIYASRCPDGTPFSHIWGQATALTDYAFRKEFGG